MKEQRNTPGRLLLATLSMLLALSLALLAVPALADDGTDGVPTDEVVAADADDDADAADEPAAEGDVADETVVTEGDAGDGANSADGAAATTSGTGTTEVSASVTYHVHCQTYGWQDWVSDGLLAGTTGQSKRLEAIEIKLNPKGVSGGIRYKVHCQTYGWQEDWAYAGAIAGTTGQSKRLEAIQIELTGDVANYYDVYYRVHCQTYGWQNWVSNGAIAGTTGQSKRLEAIQIVLVEKGGSAPSNDIPTSTSSNAASSNAATSNSVTPTLAYAAYVQGDGWQDSVSAGATAGTIGRSLRVEALNVSVNLDESELEGSVLYRVHRQSTGWSDWAADGAEVGAAGSGKRIEAVEIKLTGTLANNYDVWYRVHVQSFGWMGWTRNGATAGTTGASLRVEAVQVKLVAKGGSAPGSTKSSNYNTYAVNSKAQRVLRACKTTASPGAGLCAAWVTYVFHNAGYGTWGGNADQMYARWCTSSDLSQLKPGMIVAVNTYPGGWKAVRYGHVAIYVGNNTVWQNLAGKVGTQSFTSWYKQFGVNCQVRWGWLGGQNLS